MSKTWPIAAMVLLLWGSPARAAGPAQEEGSLAKALGYTIGPEDVLQIAVWKNDAVSRTVPVRPDGMISLPLLGDLQAAGLTPVQLREQLVKRLAEYVPQPEVSVVVMEVHSYKVSVIGKVAKPGRYELKSWATVVDVLALAGGLTEFAARSRISILRPEGRSTRKITFNYDRLAGDGSQANFHVRPGDVILVP